jgi:3-phosphoshikimate 1-carboxyvinyltransferase
MCFGMLGLRVPDIRIQNPSCVKKTFPNFFEKLTQPGAVMRDVATGRALTGASLIAE